MHWINNDPSRLRTLQPWYPGASAHSDRQEDQDRAAVTDAGGPTVDCSKLRESLPRGAATDPAELSGRREARFPAPCWSGHSSSLLVLTTSRGVWLLLWWSTSLWTWDLQRVPRFESTPWRRALGQPWRAAKDSTPFPSSRKKAFPCALFRSGQQPN